MVKYVITRIRKLWASVALLSIEMIIVFALFFIALIVFVYLVRRVFYLENNNFDHTVFEFLGQYVNETNNSIMLFITFLGKHEFLIPANLILIAYFLFIKKHRWYSIKIPAIAISSLLLMFILKQYFGRERPLIPLLSEAKGLSFPSGHALMAVTFYGLLGYLALKTVENKFLRWTLAIFFLLLIFLVGFSRIYLRVHYTSDVIAGYCIGLLWLVVSINVIDGIEKYSKRHVKPIDEGRPNGVIE